MQTPPFNPTYPPSNNHLLNNPTQTNPPRSKFPPPPTRPHLPPCCHLSTSSHSANPHPLFPQLTTPLTPATQSPKDKTTPFHQLPHPLNPPPPSPPPPPKRAHKLCPQFLKPCHTVSLGYKFDIEVLYWLWFLARPDLFMTWNLTFFRFEFFPVFDCDFCFRIIDFNCSLVCTDEETIWNFFDPIWIPLLQLNNRPPPHLQSFSPVHQPHLLTWPPPNWPPPTYLRTPPSNTNLTTPLPAPTPLNQNIPNPPPPPTFPRVEVWSKINVRLAVNSVEKNFFHRKAPANFSVESCEFL